MQVQVITGQMMTGKTTKLRAIQAYLAGQGIEVPIVAGNGFTTPYFLVLIAERAIEGAKHFLADDCTRQQIKAVLELEQRGEHSGLPEDLIVHLVRQA